MIDSYTRVIYGWKITNENKISSMIDKLDEICSEVYHNDMYNILDNLIVEDTMCG